MGTSIYTEMKGPWAHRKAASAGGVQNPSPSLLLAFSLLLVNTPARRHKLGCLFLSVLISSRACASRHADLRARVPIGTRGLVISRIDYLIPTRLSYPESIIVSRV